MAKKIRYDIIEEVLKGINDNDLMEDRREYTVEDFMSSYELTKEEAELLESYIQEQFNPGHVDIYGMKSDADMVKLVRGCLQEAEHQDFDGWDDTAKGVIRLFLRDLEKAYRLL